MTGLNYHWRPEELQARREEQDVAIWAMVKLVFKLLDLGCHFLLENPCGAPFWQHPGPLKLLADDRIHLRKGHMCPHNLRGKEGGLMEKETGWMSDLPVLIDAVALQCSGDRPREYCLSGNSKRAQVYTPELAPSVIHGLT